MDEPCRLPELAAWLRKFAEQAGAPWVWEARLMQAKALEEEAERLEHSRKVGSLESCCRSDEGRSSSRELEWEQERQSSLGLRGTRIS